MAKEPPKKKRLARWYFGGLASIGGAFMTHPLDLIKVLLQTHQGEKMSSMKFAQKIVKEQGFLALYNGISACLLRQLTYAMTRFGVYEVFKQNYKAALEKSFAAKIAAAAVAGAAGGFVGTPADMVNVRMQNDIRLPVEKRRHYKHALDGLIRVCKEEGWKKMFSGASTASTRAVFMNVGQIPFYDQIKSILLKSGYFGDNPTTHITSSLGAGIMTVILTQPIDVTKTRLMNAKKGEYKNMFDCIKSIAQSGPTGFYKGVVPSSLRVIPYTILLFVLYEQLTHHFGYIPAETKGK